MLGRLQLTDRHAGRRATVQELARRLGGNKRRVARLGLDFVVESGHAAELMSADGVHGVRTTRWGGRT
jgi:hypothetical protein